MKLATLFKTRSLLPMCTAALLGLAALTLPQDSLAKGCGPSGAALQQGPKGGCYYINRNGNKTYVDRDCCR
ncbi:hypothetical protein GCM10009304_35650 [Pseudomonas matsuisoli]|uniref:Uncharacterized protein n=1 Tax=Pseudomonas matsuisoli TaxID=1515666 RepID=A0A917V0Y7_9PSED|nr:hypothetical protein GCM10009304_35650 [Pseudomonas matsuisoli]